MKRLSIVAMLFVFMPCFPTTVFASGFSLYESGAKAVSMAGAFTAQADDASSVFYNPANITDLSGTQVLIGVTAIAPRTTFTSDGNMIMGSYHGQETTTKSALWFLPHAYMTHRINESIAVGIGVFSRFGLGNDWSRSFEGRFSAGSQYAVIKTYSISPVIAFKPAKWFSFGIGPYIQRIDVEMRNHVFIGPPTPPFTPSSNLSNTAESVLKGNDWGIGANIGVLIHIYDFLRFGVSYKSDVKHTLKGSQKLTRLSDGLSLARFDASSSIKLPATVNVGIAYIAKPWTIEADLQYTNWRAYKKLAIKLSNGTTFVSPKNWKDTWGVRIGAQYRLNDYVDLRAGYMWDQSPVPASTIDPLLPSGIRHLFCGGAGFRIGSFTIDAGYYYLLDRERRWNNAAGDVKVGPYTLSRVSGRFTSAKAHVVSLSTSYRF